MEFKKGNEGELAKGRRSVGERMDEQIGEKGRPYISVVEQSKQAPPRGQQKENPELGQIALRKTKMRMAKSVEGNAAGVQHNMKKQNQRKK